jgi:hypothetical protein
MLLLRSVLAHPAALSHCPCTNKPAIAATCAVAVAAAGRPSLLLLLLLLLLNLLVVLL